jgi:carbamoyl-phosphate synthase large subunit
MAETLKSSGPLNFQGRLVGDQFYIFEINPRFSGTSFMRALSAFNEADLWIKHVGREQMAPPLHITASQTYKRIVKEVFVG